MSDLDLPALCPTTAVADKGRDALEGGLPLKPLGCIESIAKQGTRSERLGTGGGIGDQHTTFRREHLLTYQYSHNRWVVNYMT